MMSFESEEISIANTGSLCPYSECRSFKESVKNTLTVLSSSATDIIFPSGVYLKLKISSLTLSVRLCVKCSFGVVLVVPNTCSWMISKSQNLADWSALPVTTLRPSGWTCNDQISFSWAGMEDIITAAATSKSSRWPDLVPTRTILSPGRKEQHKA